MSVSHAKEKCFGKEHCKANSANYCQTDCPFEAISGQGTELEFTLSQCNGPCEEQFGKDDKRPCEKACLGVHIEFEGSKISAIEVT